MTSRERLLNTIKRKPTDRMPITIYELCGYDYDAWYNNEPSYKKLMDIIRRDCDCLLMCDGTYIHKTFEGDEITEWREGFSAFKTTVRHTHLGDITERTRIDDNIHTLWRTEHFLKEIEDVDKYLSIPYEIPHIDMSDFFRKQSVMNENGVMLLTFEDPICHIADLFGMEELLIAILTETEKMQYFMDAVFERKIFELQSILKNNVKDVLFRLVGPEYATPPYVPNHLFRNMVTKYNKKFTEMIHEAGGLVRIHSHGKVRSVLDEFVYAGVDAIDPCEPEPWGDIPLCEIKEKYGEKLVVFGNIELLELEGSDESRVRDIVKDVTLTGNKNGGFVLMPTATPINVPLTTKTETNTLAMIETGLEYGRN